jgi:hypothetical protein
MSIDNYKGYISEARKECGIIDGDCDNCKPKIKYVCDRRTGDTLENFSEDEYERLGKDDAE